MKIATSTFTARILHPEGEEAVPAYHFRGPSEEGDPVLIECVPHVGARWLGSFAAGYDREASVTDLYEAPGDSRICVIAAGQGYIVKVDDPRDFMLVETFPITGAMRLTNPDLILFWDFTRIAAYDERQQVWETDDLSFDGITVIGLEDGRLRGAGWSPVKEADVGFVVDLRDGAHEGGASAARDLEWET